MIDPQIEPVLAYALAKHHPYGPDNAASSTHGATRMLLNTVVNCLDYALKKTGSSITVTLEKDGTLGPGNVRGLIIFHNMDTTTVPMTVTPNLVRLNDKPIFVGHSDGAVLLLNAVIQEVERALEGAKDADE